MSDIMKECRVSVLVTFYNQEKYVNKALESIISQKTNFGIKIIIGDDGSSDGTHNIIDSWLKKHPDMIELHIMDRDNNPFVPGFRASQNRLNLLNFVNTEYFIYLDGDDYFDYDLKLQHQVDILDNPSNIDCVACGHNINMLFNDGSLKPFTKLKEGKLDPKKYWKYDYIHTDTLLIRSNVISTIDFCSIKNHFNDVLITYSIIQSGKIYCIPKCWAVYVQTGDGIWTSGKAVINLIRNMMIYDLCNRINPKFRQQTNIHFYETWRKLYKIRKEINPDKLELLSKEAHDNNLKNAYIWIHYPELSLFSKLAVFFRMVLLAIIKYTDYIFVRPFTYNRK